MSNLKKRFRSSHKRWTAKEDNVLLTNPEKSYGELMQHFPDRTMKSVEMRWYNLLKRMSPDFRKKFSKRPRTKGVLKNCQKLTGKECMEVMNNQPSKFAIPDTLFKVAQNSNSVPVPKMEHRTPKPEPKPEIEINEAPKPNPEYRINLFWGMIKIR